MTTTLDPALERRPRVREQVARSAPWSLEGEPDLALVDTTWGTIQPLVLADGVRTVGELELIDLVREGAALIDTRVLDSRWGVTLPGAISIPHTEIVERQADLPTDGVAILFCNGPQCGQTPEGVHALLAVGHAPDRIAYYRGGMHDWITLALPVEPIVEA